MTEIYKLKRMTDTTNTPLDNLGQTVIINQKEKETNGIGTAGFVLALVGLFLGWIPFLGWAIWILGLIFSIIGVTKSPKGLSIAGLIISLVGIILLVLVFGAIGIIGAAAATSM